MNRRGFLKYFGKGAAATVLMPSVLAIELPSIERAEPAAELGEGLWMQLERGRMMKYAPGGITREHIKEAVEYVFKERWEEFASDTNSYLPREWEDEERTFKFAGGREQVERVAALV